MLRVLLVGVGGFLGAASRYLLTGAVHRLSGTAFPAGTLVVNVIGCLVIGAVMAMVEDRQLFGPDVRLFLVIGFLGSFTTFSAFGYETVELLRDRQLLWGFWNAAGHLFICLGAVIAGRALAKTVGF